MNNKLIKLYHDTTLAFVIDVSATSVAFLGMVLITSVRRQTSRRTVIDEGKLVSYQLISVHRLVLFLPYVYCFFNPPIH